MVLRKSKNKAKGLELLRGGKGIGITPAINATLLSLHFLAQNISYALSPLA